MNAIAASSSYDRIISRAFLILHEQPNQQCKIDLSTTTKIPEFFYLYDRGMQEKDFSHGVKRRISLSGVQEILVPDVSMICIILFP